MMLMISKRQCFNEGVQAKPDHHTPRKSARTAVIVMAMVGMGMSVPVFDTHRYGVQSDLNEKSGEDQRPQEQMRRLSLRTVIVAMVVAGIMRAMQIREVKFGNQMQHGEGDEKTPGKSRHHADVPRFVQLQTEYRRDSKHDGKYQRQVIHSSEEFLLQTICKFYRQKSPLEPMGFRVSAVRTAYFISSICRARLMAVVMRRW